MDKYRKEIRDRYGDTDAYREHEQKTKTYTKEKGAEANAGLMAILPILPHTRRAVRVQILPRHRHLLQSFRHISPPTTTPAQTRFSQVLVRCMLPMRGSRRTSISTARELRSLWEMQLLLIPGGNHVKK